MLNNCENCGGKLSFSPKDKGNVCANCGSIFPINYSYMFNKKPFEEFRILHNTELTKSMENVRCESCGASVLLTKLQMQAYCPYCNSPTISKKNTKGIMMIDSIIPFSFSKDEAYSIFKNNINRKFYANKKIFKSITKDNLYGVYVNSFIFDMDTASTYSGMFSYSKRYKNKDGSTSIKTEYLNVNGVYDEGFKNIIIEASSNIEQSELQTILPFNFTSAVQFDVNFMYGYMLEYHDKMFDVCVKDAEKMIENSIRRSLLAKHNCDRIVSLNLNTNYYNKQYNYCLLITFCYSIFFVYLSVKTLKIPTPIPEIVPVKINIGK